MNTASRRLSRALALISCLSGAAFAQGAPAASVLVLDDFSATRKNWDWHGEIAGGEFILTALTAARYGGSQALLKEPVLLPPPAGGEAIRVRFKITGMTDVASGKVASEARFFLVPEPLSNPTFADPYSNPSALTLLVSANNEKETIQISLFQKTEQPKGGYGTPLYSATLPLTGFPLTLDWWISRSAYKLDMEPKGMTVDGSRQGSLALGAVWEGDLRYVMRAVNAEEGVKTRLRIDDFSITTGTLPE
ncbi:MAG: hypothetical protein K0R17_588 [Rariglobus sp.]|jgi:hypothetical protein|nr:hypothetical protein [Rariglobus sp.]